MNQKKKLANKEFWLWLGGALLMLIFIIAFLAIPFFDSQSSPPTPSETTTEKPQKPESSRTPTKDEAIDDFEAPKANSEPQSESVSEPQPESTPEPSRSQTYTTPSTASTCHHEESGRCWDDLEDEAYSAGQYDRQFGYYGATLEYADDCNALCREIIEDAYDEGWYDF